VQPVAEYVEITIDRRDLEMVKQYLLIFLNDR